ncbi:MAG: 50S ribosomal protein L25/general stress protein Ctc [Alphaproteobacteria bacterium]|jgi:large subunit ribosomal protein L25|nr:50S ribosomal protein L25/general stress protein Ctc [Alphaproteobacteria bacterium]
MTEQFTFTATLREKVGKGASREARRQGLVPATIYGDNKEPTSVCLSPKEVMSQLVKNTLYNNIYKVDIDGKAQEVLIRDIQLHPVSDNPLHVDMLRVGAKTITRMEIPVVFHNQAKSPGLRFGGSLNILLHYLEIAANPKKAPKQIDIDLAEATSGTVIKIEDIKLPEGVKTYYPKGTPIASLTSQAAGEEEAAK